jgi:GH15 family glucan-1,4-alpha-glucosidase
VRSTSRRYLDGTTVIETRFETETGVVILTDCLAVPVDWHQVDLLRMVRCVEGEVPMHMQLILRFDYGRVVPWVRRRGYGLHAVAGPDAVQLRCSVPLHGEGLTTQSDFTLKAGEQRGFLMTGYPSHWHAIHYREPDLLLSETLTWWRAWSSRCRPVEPWTEAVQRSLVTLKALTYQPTGGMVAAATTSLPEALGGVRNWDYRYCWIRDATFTLYALLGGGYTEEARAWQGWLLRSAAGEPGKLQIMYGLSGERRLSEHEVPWLAGYAGSAPVRIGNAAHDQFQLDVYGELMDAFHAGRRFGMEADADSWRVQRSLMDFVAQSWHAPDEGIWEVRGPRRHFTHSKVMAWVAVDRSIKAIEQFGLDGPLEQWRSLREAIHADICRKGFSEEKNSFVQYYGGECLDAALLLLPQVGFLPPDDPRVLGTIEAVRRELVSDGLVCRYSSSPHVDALPKGEGTFLACSFWLADALALAGRREEAEGLFERLLALRNDLGLLAEEYDPEAGRFLGNFPQAFSHVGLVGTALNLSRPQEGPAEARGSDD